MPYILFEDRLRLQRTLYPLNAGEINYLISDMINGMLSNTGLSYARANEIIGALECCKLELYRRVIAPYEDKKIIENGDVYNFGPVEKLDDLP